MGFHSHTVMMVLGTSVVCVSVCELEAQHAPRLLHSLTCDAVWSVARSMAAFLPTNFLLFVSSTVDSATGV